MDKRRARELLDRLRTGALPEEIVEIWFEVAALSGVKFFQVFSIVSAPRERSQGALIAESTPVNLSWRQLIATHPQLFDMLLALAKGGGAREMDTTSLSSWPKDWHDFLLAHPFLPEIDWCFFVPVFRSGNSLIAAIFFAEQRLESDARQLLADAIEIGAERLSKFNDVQLPPKLTARQREVLRHCADGNSDWDIGLILGISPATVHEHVEVAKRKLGVRTRIQAIALATKNGWL